MKKKVVVAILALSLSAFTLTACGKKEDEVAGVETSEEEKAALEEKNNKIIAEYAAGILMKYNSGSNTRVLDGYKLLLAEEKEIARLELEQKRQQEKAAYEAANAGTGNADNQDHGKSQSSSNESVANGTVEAVSYVEDMAQPTGLSGFSITYKGYEVTPSYPNSDNGMFFTVDAAQGYSLVVTKFNIANNSGQTSEVNMLGIAPDFTLRTSGRNIRAQRTMLLEDLSMYKGSMEAGDTVEGVIIFEVPSEDVAAIDGMELIVTVGETNTWMKLEEGSTATAVPTEVIVEEEPTVWDESDDSENQNDSVESTEPPAVDNGMVESDVQEDEAGTITTVGSQGSISVEPAN